MLEEIDKTWPPAAIKLIQHLLQHLGHYRGKIDGDAGERTLKALADWHYNY